MDISEFRHELRSLLVLRETIEKYAIIYLRALPSSTPGEESNIKVMGLDRAMSREHTGFGQAGQGEDVGAWSVQNLPDRSATGMYNPTPWILFMDWFWQLLREQNLEPMGLDGFGDDKPGPKTVAQKRMKKYGEGARGEYDVKRDLTVAINSIGNNEDEVARNFRKIMAGAQTPGWFNLVEVRATNEWYAIVQMEIEMPDGWADRKANMDNFKEKHRQEWKRVISKLADGRTNPAQLSPLVKLFLVKKHGFPYPFNTDVMSDEDFQRAVTLVMSMKLEELVEFAKAEGKLPPIIGKARIRALDPESLQQRWTQIVDRLATELDADHPTVQVALADYMVQKAGFPDPFEPELMSPNMFSRAMVYAGRLRGEDLRPFTESIQQQVKRLLSE